MAIVPTNGPLLPDLAPHHFSVSVPDIEAAIRWYADILGFAPEIHFTIDSIGAQWAFLKRDALRIELWQLGSGAAVPEARKDPGTDLKTGGTKHVAFTVPNLQECLELLVARGVDIAAVQRQPIEPMVYDSEPTEPSKPPAFAAFIRDPAGTLIELLDSGRLQAMQSP
jgi:methylmalonyl-CoA/ethylmalonyl-CoA epimerase